jgi:two-component system sensor histidine kinase BaeS
VQPSTIAQLVRADAGPSPHDVLVGSLRGALHRLRERVGGPRLSTKLFLALVAINALVAGAMILAARYSFKTGFVGYLNDQSIEQLQLLIPRFEAAYAQHGSWQFITVDRRVWFEFVLQPDPFMPGPVLSHPPRPPAVVLMGLFNRFQLLDARQHRLTGNPEVTPPANRRPIVVGGRIVGWLGVMPFESVTGPAGLRFQQRQYIGIWAIVGSSILLAALAALLLTRSLTNSVRRIAAALHDLAAGGYSQRLQFRSRDEIGRLANDFNDLARALERHEQMRRSFMADVSHELRTPLTVLRGLMEAIEDGLRAPTPETMRSLETEIRTMSKLVNDLYDLSVSDLGTLGYRKLPVDIGELLRVALDAFSDRLSARSLAVRHSIPEQGVDVEADEARLHQLFNNILENSVRYADPGAVLLVRLVTRQSEVVIDFEDSGPGVPPTCLPYLFERFYRVDPSRSRATGGAGLGLAICHNIVDAHGGTITARPSTLGGLWIRIALPLGRAAAP